MLTNQELQTLHNMGNEAADAASEIERLLDALAGMVALQLLELRPDDRLVIICPQRLSIEQAAQLRQSMLAAFPGRMCVVLDSRLALGAVGGFGNRPPLVVDATQDQRP